MMTTDFTILSILVRIIIIPGSTVVMITIVLIILGILLNILIIIRANFTNSKCRIKAPF